MAQSGGKIHPLWTLLDSQSTVDVFSNSRFLKNIRRVRATLTIHSTRGTTKTNVMGFLPGYGWVWYHPGRIASILSLARVVKTFRVVYNSEVNNAFHVHVAKDRMRLFIQSPKGLYYSNFSKNKSATVLVNTVDHNKTKYSDCDYSHAVQARTIQNILGNPSYCHF